MSSFACAFTLLLPFVLLLLHGSSAVSYKNEAVKNSKLQAVKPALKKVINRHSILNLRNSRLHKTKKAYKKPVRRLKKIVVRPKKKHGIKAQSLRRAKFDKKKKILPKFKSDKTKNKKMLRYKNKKPKSENKKAHRYKNKKSKNGFLEKKKVKNGLRLKKHLKLMKDEVIKKDSTKYESGQKNEIKNNKKDSTANTSTSKIIKKDNIKYVSGINKGAEHDKVDSKAITITTLATSEVITQKNEVTTSLVDELHFTSSNNVSTSDTTKRKSHILLKEDTSNFYADLKDETFRELKKHIKHHGGDPSNFHTYDLCYKVVDQKCYQRNYLACKKTDRKGKCLKGYRTITRYDDSGKLISLPPQIIDKPEVYPTNEPLRNYDSTAKEGCVYHGDCVQFNKFLERYPHVANKLVNKWGTALDNYNRYPEIAASEYFQTMWKKRQDGTMDAMSVLVDVLENFGNDSDCFHLIILFKFLEEPFAKISERKKFIDNLVSK